MFPSWQKRSSEVKTLDEEYPRIYISVKFINHKFPLDSDRRVSVREDVTMEGEGG